MRNLPRSNPLVSPSAARGEFALVAALLLSDTPTLRGLRQQHRYACVLCGEPIPPGKAGRQCKLCRGEDEEQGA